MDAVGTGPDGALELAPQNRIVLADSLDRRADRLCDAHASPLGARGRPPVAAAEPDSRGELALEEIDLLASGGGAFRIIERGCLFEVLAQLLEPVAIGRFGLRIEERSRIPGIAECGARIRSGKFQRVDLGARPPQQRRDVANALAVTDADGAARELERPHLPLSPQARGRGVGTEPR